MYSLLTLISKSEVGLTHCRLPIAHVETKAGTNEVVDICFITEEAGRLHIHLGNSEFKRTITSSL